MKELIIHDNEAGQRLDKLLRKYLSEAPGSFIYKMLRKKNIVLNGKKATGNEHLRKGDSVKLFLADDTIAKFQAAGKTVEENIKNTVKLDVIYEDQNVIFINKPSGMLSQKAKETDVSVVENVTAYLLESGQLTKENLHTFRPSICNRLDRNTSGLIVAGKSLAGLQQMGDQACRDWTNQEIAEHLGLSVNTVKHYVSGILEKLQIDKRDKIKEFVNQ